MCSWRHPQGPERRRHLGEGSPARQQQGPPHRSVSAPCLHLAAAGSPVCVELGRETWHVSTSVSVNGNSFAVANQNCSSPSSCAAEPPFGGFTSGPADPMFLISVGSILADVCSTTYSDGTSQSCVGAKSGNVDLTATLLDAAGQLVLVTPIPSTVTLFATGLVLLAAFRRRKPARA